MCPFCEGQVEIGVMLCPFCGGEIGSMEDSSPTSSKDVRSLSPQETLASLYPPPYRAKAEEISQPKEASSYFIPPAKEEALLPESSDSMDTPISSSFFWSFILFSVGINLLFLSFFLFFFSTDGEVQLHWKGYWWVIYFMTGLVAAIFGYKKLKTQDPSSEN